MLSAYQVMNKSPSPYSQKRWEYATFTHKFLVHVIDGESCIKIYVIKLIKPMENFKY